MKTVKPLLLRFYSFIYHNLPFAPMNTTFSLPCLHAEGVWAHVFLVFLWESVSVCQPHWQLDTLHYSFHFLGWVIKQFSALFLAFQFRQANFTRTKPKKSLLPSYLTQLLYTRNDAAYLLFYISFLISFELRKYTVISYKLTDAYYLFRGDTSNKNKQKKSIKEYLYCLSQIKSHYPAKILLSYFKMC